MKKIKLTIGALLITGVGFTTNPTSQPTKQELVREITIGIEDLIEFVKEDEFNGRMMTKELSDTYIQNLIDVLSKVEDLNTVDQYVDCENCDEID
jgi:hypothetical protein